MNETSGTTAADAPAQPPTEVPEQDGATQGGGTPVSQEPATAAPQEPTSFGGRGRMRRRARFLRRARELAYRDLGGLVFDLHRYGQRNDALVLAKLTTLTQIDSQLRALEAALDESRPVTVLREAGITACPRCAAIHSSEDNFCPNCGFSVERNVDLPIAGAATPQAAAPAAPAPYAAGPATQQQQYAIPNPYASAPAGPPTQQYTAPSPYAQPPPREPTPASADAAPTPMPAPAGPGGESAATASEPPPGGRSPAPPSRPGRDEATEILRPPSGR